MSSPQQTGGIIDSISEFIFGPKPLTPEENVKKWQDELQKEKRNIDRQIRSVNQFCCFVLNSFLAIQREQTKVQREIKILTQKARLLVRFFPSLTRLG